MTSSDAPQPPGGPLRDDEPDGDLQPDGDHESSSGSAGPGSVQSEEAARLQEENAETSLDQPSQ